MAISDLRAVALSPSNGEQSVSALRHPSQTRASAEVPAHVMGDRRQNRSGNLGNRRTDNWMPYSTAFVAQLLGQQLDEQQRAQNSENIIA